MPVWSSFRRMKLFNKIYLINFLIIMLSLYLLANIISGSVSNSALERDARYTRLVLYNMDSFLNQKHDMLLRFVKQAYSLAAAKSDDPFELLYTPENLTSQHYLQLRKRFMTYLESAFSEDAHLAGITACTGMDGACYRVSRNLHAKFPGDTGPEADRLKAMDNESLDIRIFQAHQPDYLPNRHVYTLAINIKSVDTYDKIGTLFMDFTTEGVTQTLTQYYEEITSDILIVGREGNVIYDSSGRYLGQVYPHMDLVDERRPEAIVNGSDSMMSYVENTSLDTVTIGILPVDRSLAKIKRAKQDIYLVSFLGILAISVLTFINIKAFSRRVRSIMYAIKKVRQGNLSNRIPLGRSKDELYEISTDFNQMCADLESYIDQVYISQIKQKTAELQQKNASLVALQAQINPHFLYNTLEVIRMKANGSGAKEAGDMIYLLSRLLRNAIKEEGIIDIHEELESSKLYFRLYQFRYGDKLHVAFDIEESILEYGIPRHAIQPIIENYIVHGFDGSRSDNRIRIAGYARGDGIEIRIEDNGPGIDENKLDRIKEDMLHYDMTNNASIGLMNVNERLRLIYGDPYGLEIESRAGSGTTVTLKLKSMKVKELRAYVQGTDR